MDLLGLRQFVREQMGGRWTVNALYAEALDRAGGELPVSRATFYRCLSSRSARVPADLVLCIEHLAAVLSVPEGEMFKAARLVTPDDVAARELRAARTEFQEALSAAEATIERAGLSVGAEADVMDRLVRRPLGYRFEVLPVHRGNVMPLHLRSWIAFHPTDHGLHTRSSLGLASRAEDRRNRLRYDVIGDALWRSTGMRWRDPVPIELLSGASVPDAVLELPAEERDRQPRPQRAWSMRTSRVMVLSPLWGHPEPLVAMLADSMGWASSDVRNHGFSFVGMEKPKIDHLRELLTDAGSSVVHAVAETGPVLEAVQAEVLDAATRSHVVWITYGSSFRRAAAAAFRVSPDVIERSADTVDRLACEIARTRPVIRVDHADSDVVAGGELGKERLDRDLIVDHVRLSAAAVLDELRLRGGRSIEDWGPRFADLRLPGSPSAHLPPRATTVRVLAPMTS